ncbi:MAG: glycosyltransferase family 9 protein [Chitinophagales bacterium]|nr:glycosyltransferase family 9 protein [Chitinophagales bacterium]
MKKILVIRFSSIGDIVLTTPVIRCIKEQVKDVELHFITKDENRQILAENPYIDKLLFLQSSLWKTAQMLKRERYDYVIDLHHNQRTWLLKRMLGVKSFSFPKLNFEKWLMVNFKINQLPALHIVDRYFEAVKHIGVENDGKGLDFFVGKGLGEMQSIEGPYIAWAIGAKQQTKQLPVHKIIEALNSEYFPTMKVVLLGGKEDSSKADQIIAGTQHSNVVSLVGKCSLQVSASVVQSAQLVITNDTGLMHIAAAMQRPIVSLWGNTIPAFGMFPYYGQTQTENRIVQVPELDCRPCSKIGYNTCPKGHFKCMQNIAVPELIEHIKMLIQ